MYICIWIKQVRGKSGLKVMKFTEYKCRSIVFSVLFLVVTAGKIENTENVNECLTIGAIAKGEQSTKNETIVAFTNSARIVWNYINTNEIYQIFRTVRKLDERNDIDIITLYDYDPTILTMPHLLETKSKDIIKWGDKADKGETMVKKSTNFMVTPTVSDDICGGEIDTSLLQGDLYCKTDINISGDSTFPHDYMTVTAPKALVHLIETLKWTSVFIVHENATERETRVLVDSLSERRVLLVIFNIDTVQDFHATLRHAYNQTVPFELKLNFVVLCRFNCARSVFRTANKFDSLNTKQNKTLLKKFSHWLVTVYGHSKGVSHALQACADDLDNVVIVAIPEFSGSGTQDLGQVLKDIFKEIHLTQPSNDSLEVKQYMIQLLKQRAIEWGPSSRCKGYNIDTLLWAETGRRFSSVGYIDVAGNVELKAKLFPNTQFGYNKRKFIVSTLEYDPFVIRTGKNGTDAYEGSHMDLLRELARVLNFTYEIIEPEDQKWGSLEDTENGTIFNGLIGQLQREECDIVAAPLSHDSIRDKIVDFSYPVYYEYTTVLTKKPDPQATKWRTFVDLFHWKVMVAIAISLGVVTVLIFFIEKYNPYYDIPTHGEERSRNGGLHYFHNSFWYIYGALLCQGGVHLPDSNAGRTLVSCWWLMCIVVVGIYSGNLIAFLTVSKEKAPFNTLEEMTKQKGYKWGTLGGTVWDTLFMSSKIPDYKEIGDGLRKFSETDSGVLHINVSYHINRVHEGNYAWIGDKTKIEIAISEWCDLIKIKEEFLPLKYAFGFQQHSPHTQIFSQKIMKIHEGGLFQIWKRKWWPKTNFCASEKVTYSKSLFLVDVQSAFYVCVIGTFVGLTAFIAEIVIYKVKTHRKERDRRVAKIQVSVVSTNENKST